MYIRHTHLYNLDLRKAFDSVSHSKLLDKLRDFGIFGDLWNWFYCYLSDHMQCVCINSAISDFLPVISGIYAPREYPWPNTLYNLCQ